MTMHGAGRRTVGPSWWTVRASISTTLDTGASAAHASTILTNRDMSPPNTPRRTERITISSVAPLRARTPAHVSGSADRVPRNT